MGGDFLSNVIGFKAFKNTLKRDSGYAPVSGENGYSVIRCVFPVGGDWDNISAATAGFFVHPKNIAGVTAAITADGEERAALFVIPAALLKQGERIHFGLFATVGGVTIATNTVALDVERGIVSDDIDYDPEEAAGMFEQFSNALNTALLGKANKAAAGSAGELAALDGNGSPIRSGVSVIQSIGEGSNSRVPTTAAVKNALDGKADKAADGTDGELAALDDNGALKRSGVTVAQSVGEGSADKVPTTEAVRNALNDAEDTIAENIDSIFQGNSAFFPQLYFEQYFTANGSNYRLIYDDRDGERHVLFDFAQLPAATGEKGEQGDPGNDYVLTEQDKADIAGMVDISGKADKATTLAGYGITDAYTKTQTDTFFSDTNADIADLKAYIGYTDGDILGLHADFENKVFTRLGAAVGLTAGQDFNAFTMYGQRRRVVVDSNGVIDETESPENITENDTNVDVMVYQPKFYYKVVPLKLEKQSGGLGYHIRKANYYISSTPHAGFKLHPLFYDANGNEVDYVLFSAYEASYMWRRQVNATDYINEIFHDGVDTDTTIDTTAVLKSLPGVKPISGQYKAMNKVNMENCALRKSSNWHLDTIQSVAANQLLVAVEYGTFNTQSAIGLGIVNNSNSNSNNYSSLTGSTSAETFNTASGMASETIYDDAGTETPFNTNGKVAVSYRGMENPWGNIWKHVNGINIWGDGTMNGGQVYIADNFNFNESRRSENYKSAGFTIANTSGYISAFGYGDEDYDWLFIPSETAGNSSIPVGDREFCTSNLSAYKIARYGGNWSLGNLAGAFCLDCNSGTGFNYLYIGGRLLYVPTATGFGPQGPAGSNYALTAADRQAIAQIAMNGLNGNGVAY